MVQKWLLKDSLTDRQAAPNDLLYVLMVFYVRLSMTPATLLIQLQLQLVQLSANQQNLQLDII